MTQKQIEKLPSYIPVEQQKETGCYYIRIPFTGTVIFFGQKHPEIEVDSTSITYKVSTMTVSVGLRSDSLMIHHHERLEFADKVLEMVEKFRDQMHWKEVSELQVGAELLKG